MTTIIRNSLLIIESTNFENFRLSNHLAKIKIIAMAKHQFVSLLIAI